MKREYKQFALLDIIVVLILLVSYLLLCGNRAPSIRQPGLSLADFGFVHLGIPFSEISEKLAEPDVERFYMYEYKLADGSRIILRVPGEKLKGIWVLREDGTRIDFFTGEVILEPALKDFDFLERRIMYDEVIDRVGEPHVETGSGMPVAIYRLTDGCNLVLSLGTRWEQTHAVDVVMDAWVISQDGSSVDFFEALP
jgi:hypothetical protein